MKRLHVNMAVTDLEASIGFYSVLFDAPPTVLKDDYAKWMLDDPRVNFAITTRGVAKGVDHLGIQVESDEELGTVHSRMKSADARIVEQGETTCCYAHSSKNWIFDPDGIAWETFLTRGESAVYGSDDLGKGSACCDRPTEDSAAAEPVAKDATTASTASCCR